MLNCVDRSVLWNDIGNKWRGVGVQPEILKTSPTMASSSCRILWDPWMTISNVFVSNSWARRTLPTKMPSSMCASHCQIISHLQVRLWDFTNIFFIQTLIGNRDPFAWTAWIPNGAQSLHYAMLSKLCCPICWVIPIRMIHSIVKRRVFSKIIPWRRPPRSKIRSRNSLQNNISHIFYQRIR